MKVEFTYSVGYAGCEMSEILEFPDNTPESEINQYAHDGAQEHAASWEGDTRLMNEEDWADEEIVEQFYTDAEGCWKVVD